ncbi:mechanosensitive ion channel domain-containing protein [Microbacterium murale]|uniref:Mechanosensitive ion channel protein MscS n=1 Tax=Microbacterium murale TaxID=1081040 RepID=A0ABQ1RU21_9MICO|nr:mechanosensitive ion channel domain-containing protein [Microbacterium murale]GGD81736.1 mechanosensitive ion channel protein MscS [Microbacterium murale]
MDLRAWIPDNLTWLDIGLAVASLIVGWVLSRFAKRGVRAIGHRTPGITDPMTNLAGRITQYTIVLLGVGVALAFLGANIQPLIAMVVVVAVVLVLVLRGIADNFAAGVLLQTRKPIVVGDEIQVEGPDGEVTGTVIELNGRAVVLTTTDGRVVHVPNGSILRESIINNSTHGARRSEVHVRVRRSVVAVDAILERLLDAVGSADGVHQREHPRALVTTVSPRRVSARLQFWHHPLHGVAVTDAVVRALGVVIDENSWVGIVTSEQTPSPLTPPEDV